MRRTHTNTQADPHAITPHISPSQYLYDVPLAAGQEASVEYALAFHKDLPPREFQLVIFLYTPGEPGAFAPHVAYNQVCAAEGRSLRAQRGRACGMGSRSADAVESVVCASGGW